MLANYQVRVLLNLRGSLNVYTLRIAYSDSEVTAWPAAVARPSEVHSAVSRHIPRPDRCSMRAFKVCVHSQRGTSYDAGDQLALTTPLTFNIYKARPR